jgi:hypothetical protein
MYYITGKHIPRRTFLRGLGAVVALPYLESMVPAGKPGAEAAAGSNTRLVCIEEVHGLAGCSRIGMEKFLYAPEKIGRDFEFSSESALRALKPYQDDLTIVSNTDVRMAEAYALSEIGADHFRSSAVFLTQSHPKQTQGSDLWVGNVEKDQPASMDQMQAKKFGQDTPLPSLQLCIENLDQAGTCTYNYHCAYTDAISWAKPNQPLPMIRDPRQAFDLLFGVGSSNEDREERKQIRKSVIDVIRAEVASLSGKLPASDRNRLNQYLQSVDEVDRRIKAVEARNNSGEAREMPNAPAGVPDSFSEHMRLMYDIQVLAMQNDMTRVIAFKTGRDADQRRFPESEVPTAAFHPSSHYNGEAAVLTYNKINYYRVSQMAYFAEKLRNTMDGGKSLMEQSIVLWGSPMSDSSIHAHRHAPLFFLGRGNGLLPGNMHFKADDGTPMANVMLSVLHYLGHNMESFGDSTGEFSFSTPSTVL